MKALKRAGLAKDATESGRASTALQFKRLAPLFKLDIREASQALGIKSVALITGHMFRASEMDAETQAVAGKAVRAQAETILDRTKVGHLYGALACGADIAVGEAAVDLGIPFHVVLPFPVSRFCELSVRICDFDGSSAWQQRFDKLLGEAASLDMIDDEMPLDRDLDGHFFYGFRYAVGAALLRAGTLQADCRLIAVTDGRIAEEHGGRQPGRRRLGRRGTRGGPCQLHVPAPGDHRGGRAASRRSSPASSFGT